jgi:TctA family transporter
LIARVDVERGINETRMNGFALILTTGVAVGLAVGVPAGASLGVLSGVVAAAGAALLLALIYRVRFIRHRVMQLMHSVTGQ